MDSFKISMFDVEVTFIRCEAAEDYRFEKDDKFDLITEREDDKHITAIIPNMIADSSVVYRNRHDIIYPSDCYMIERDCIQSVLKSILEEYQNQSEFSNLPEHKRRGIGLYEYNHAAIQSLDWLRETYGDMFYYPNAMSILKFISNLRGNSDNVLSTFHTTYSYHFAKMIQGVFDSGVVCLAAPKHHFVYAYRVYDEAMEKNPKFRAFDINGEYDTSRCILVPEKHIESKYLSFYLRLPGIAGEKFSREDMVLLMKTYCEFEGISYNPDLESEYEEIGIWQIPKSPRIRRRSMMPVEKFLQLLLKWIRRLKIRRRKSLSNLRL